MLTAIATILFNILRSVIQFLLPVRDMNSKAAPANADVAYANYRTFSGLNAKVRESLSKAIDADEKRTDKSGVILLYKNVLKQLQAALAIDPFSCPANKRAEVQRQQEKLHDFMGQTQERLKRIEEGGAISRPMSSLSSSSSVAVRARHIPIVASTSQQQGSIKPLTNSALLRNVDSKFGDEILATLITTTGIRLTDIEGNAAAKEALKESVVLPALNPALFTGLRAPCKGILLFGPPGNGKTMLAKAVANESGHRFFNISAATIMSKWVGDGERIVRALFQVARNAQPSIIFIDEVDSMLCERSEHENGAARRVKTEFLIQLDGCTSGRSDERVLVLAATNRPHELDEGILRRFEQRILIDLPDQRARANMIRRTFEQHRTKIQLTDRELQQIAAQTEHYSYSDLLALCRAAALIPVQSVRQQDLRHCSADQLRPVDVTDLWAALQKVKPSVNLENRRKLIDFATNYAQMT